MGTNVQQEIEISAWGAVVQYFLSQSALTSPDVFENRIAGRHKYSNGWKPGSLGMAIKPDGGPDEMYVSDMTQRFECRIYADTGYNCELAYMKVKPFIKYFQRCVVDRALIQRMWTETTPMLLEDQDLKLPMYMFFFYASVSEQGV